ncbi:flagellar protein [Lutibacter sp. B2]|nr:flagellar protein [Lutibacter sp. B2]
MNKINLSNNRISTYSKPNINLNNTNKSFGQVLDTIVDSQSLKFSKHAMEKLESRQIKLHKNEIQKIKNALNKAEKKGIKETLILMDNKAFVASVKNKTIITAALDEQLNESVFTNIDGAVII